ncbi:HEAT repeat domain-containing protein [Ktedonobacteria bacterium brp13]|nr:HEAT repeat domain-containing protein [Ktedonobacteria bacterium brp13]
MQHNKGRKKENEDVKVLIEALRDTDNRARQRQAAMALGQFGDVRAVEPLIEALRDNYSGIRERAVVALGQIGDVRAVEPLIALLSDNDGWVRRQVAVALGQLRDVRAIKPLIALLSDNESWVREQVVIALGKLGWKPANETQSAWLAIAQQNWGRIVSLGSATVEPLIEALQGNDKQIRGHAAIGLGRLGDVRAVEPLIEALRDNESGVREQAAVALGKLGDGRAVEELIEALSDRDSGVRKKAVGALSQFGDVRAVEPLIELLSDNDGWVREQVVIALVQLGDVRAVEPLIELLSDNDGWARRQVAVALGQLGDVRAIEPLIELLSDRDRGVREQVAVALGKLGWKPANETQSAWLAIAQQNWDRIVSLGSATVEPLIEALQGNDKQIRGHAAIGLGKLGDVRAVEPLIEALRDNESWVREQVAVALGKLGWKPANETQSAWMAIAQQDWDRVVNLGSATVEPLIEVLKDYNSDVRKSAARILEEIGDPRGIDALRMLRLSERLSFVATPLPPRFVASGPPPPRFVASGPPPPNFAPAPPSTFVMGKWQGGIIAISVLFLMISVVATFVVKMTRTEHLPPTAGPWNVLLFVCQMILLTITVCFTPTCVSLLLRRSGRIVSLLTESVAYIVIFLGFALWLFGTSALGSWLFYAAALVPLIEIGSHYIEWYKENTLKRIRRAASYTSIEVDVKALEKMTRDEVVLYISVPVGLALGTVAGLILRQTTVQIIALCLQIVLLFASFILLYFLFVSFLRMADPLFKTTPKLLPALTKPKQKGKRKAKASQVSQEIVDQQYIDVASDVSGLRMVYKYDALHNTIVLVACILIVIKIWLFPIDTKWLIASFLFATLVCSEIPYAIGQYLLHTRILEEYTGARYVEMTKKLQDYAPIFPPKAFLGALLTTSVAGGILDALLSQMVQDAIATLIK